jgi:hypothetical protein
MGFVPALELVGPEFLVRDALFQDVVRLCGKAK